MKTNRMKRFAVLVFALTVTATTSILGNNQGRDRINRGACANQISNLSADQKEKITSLQNAHLKTMDQLREKRQNTTDLKQKAQIRNEMDQEVTTYRNSVKSLLSPEQQSQFNPANSNRNRQFNCTGRGQGNSDKKGQRSGNGSVRGPGNGTCRQL